MHFDIARVEEEIEITRIFPELEERLIGTCGLGVLPHQPQIYERPECGQKGAQVVPKFLGIGALMHLSEEELALSELGLDSLGADRSRARSCVGFQGENDSKTRCVGGKPPGGLELRIGAGAELGRPHVPEALSATDDFGPLI
jgi:hypothetical protein